MNKIILASFFTVFLSTMSAYAQCKQVVKEFCAPTPPTCTQVCYYITDPPSCKQVCTPNPPRCTDVIHEVCPPPPPPPPIMVDNSPTMIRPIIEVEEEELDDGVNLCAYVKYGPEYKCEIIGGMPIITPLADKSPSEDTIDLACANVTPALGYKCVSENGVATIIREDGFDDQINNVPGISQCAWTLPAEGYECHDEGGKTIIRKIIENNEPDMPEIDPFCTMAEFYNDPRCRPKNIGESPFFEGVSDDTCLTTGVTGFLVCGKFKD